MNSYSYCVLRYVHDIGTSEFVNVGIVLYSRNGEFIGAKFRNTYARVTGLFPNANGDYFRKKLKSLEKKAASLAVAPNAFSHENTTALSVAHALLARDDSSFQWGELGVGTSKDLQTTLDRLFDRLVSQYDIKTIKSRTDNDVWRVFSTALQSRNALPKLVEKRVVGTVDQVKFHHAWKNGIWHCFEPLSFDLHNPDSIREKAHRWLGQMLAVKDTLDEFKVYFLIGEPDIGGSEYATSNNQRAQLAASYKTARLILEQIPGQKAVFTEADVEDFSSLVKSQLTAHQEAQS